MFKVTLSTILVISFSIIFAVSWFINTGANVDNIIYKIHAFFRRKRALKFSKNFLTEGDNYYKLQNSFVTVTADKNGNTLRCYNRKNNKESI